jgi:Tfp pilus assembly PilM family ATPase
LLDLGVETAALLILADGEPVFIREISIGSGDFTEMFKRKIEWEERSDAPMNLQDLAEKNPDFFNEAIYPLISQIRLSLSYFLNNNPAAEAPQQAFLSGDLSTLPVFQDCFRKILEIEPCLWDCLQGIEIGEQVSKSDLDSFRAMLPVAVGLALRGRTL